MLKNTLLYCFIVVKYQHNISILSRRTEMKKKIIALLTAVFALVTGLFVLTGCSNTPQNGFDIELAKAFAEETGIELRLQEIKWENKMTEINSGNIDLIWNGMTIQPEMENNLEISNPYMTNSQVMLVRADSDLTYEKIMADKDIRITAEGDSAGAAWIADNGFENFINADNQIKTMTEVKANTADVAVLDSVLANYYITNDESSFQGELKIVEDESGNIKTLSNEVYGIAAKKGNVGLIAKVNDVLASIYADGTMMEIADKYGLEANITASSFENYTPQYDSLSAAEKASWEAIAEKGYIIVGYTIFAPIAY